uniref:IRS-type PTB domain-containing protein n=1 Tax=Pseudonaja textilis TaxID=8673 RepID=A0A670ZSH6_PSETE
MFSFEAGRRCESGPGNFTFETKQGNEIFNVVEAAIQAQKAQVEEHRRAPRSALAAWPSVLWPDFVYADPVDSQRLEEGPGWGSGLVEEQLRPQTGKGHGLPSDKQHIYDEPEGRAPWPTPPLAAIYDEARLPCEAWRTQGLESQAGYELPCLPGTGDYAVPASKPKAAPAPEGLRNTNNSNNGGDPIYSRVFKPPSAPGPLGPEQSVDESRLAAVYEDLGEI